MVNASFCSVQLSGPWARLSHSEATLPSRRTSSVMARKAASAARDQVILRPSSTAIAIPSSISWLPPNATRWPRVNQGRHQSPPEIRQSRGTHPK